MSLGIIRFFLPKIIFFFLSKKRKLKFIQTENNIKHFLLNDVYQDFVNENPEKEKIFLKIGNWIYQFYFFLVKKPDVLFSIILVGPWLILVGPWLIFIFFFIKELIIFQQPEITWGFHIFLYRVGMMGGMYYLSKSWIVTTYSTSIFLIYIIAVLLIFFI